MSDFLLEIGLEEVPAGKIIGVIDNFKSNLENELLAKEIPFKKIDTLGTSRRFTVIIRDIAEKGRELLVENKGPSLQGAFKDGEPTKALQGFCKGQGIEVSDVVIKELKGSEYVYCVKKIPGAEVKKILPEILTASLNNLYFSKPMNWGTNKTAFIRPIRSIVALWDEEVIEFEYAGIKADRYTTGHRFLSSAQVEITKVTSYEEEMAKAFVVVDINKRRKIIEEGITRLAESIDAKALLEEDLLDEVNFLVEYPTAFLADFDQIYLKLPKEVIITTMVNNQKYFPVVAIDNTLLNYFIGVRCGNDQFLDNVIKGNQKVLKARLEDAVFFYNEDLKKPLLELRDKLDKVIYQEKLGSVGEKIDRIKILSKYIADKLEYQDENIELAASLAKMDLATHMVYEFPELQGIMGYYYALEEGYHREVALSILEHYKPVAAGDMVPSSDLGIIIALSDKIDTLTSIVKAGLIPKGSQDPYGLRRIALGIIRIIIENQKHISIKDLLVKSQSNLPELEDQKLDFYLDFLMVRFRSYMEKEGLSYDLIDSILALEFDDLYTLYLKAIALKKYSSDKGFIDLINLLTRVSNIVKDAESEVYDKNKLMEKAEIILEENFSAVKAEFDELYIDEDFIGCLNSLGKLKESLDDFFNEVMVMVEDEEIKNNRISLLNSIRKLGEKLFIAKKIVN